MSQQTVSNLERFGYQPRSDYAATQRVCQALGRTIEEVFPNALPAAARDPWGEARLRSEREAVSA